MLLLLRPFEFPLVVVLCALAVVFTVAPEALDHAPISFETRGVIHHIWHYGLMAGSLLTLAGLLSGRDKIEFAGLLVLIVVIAENLIAVVSDTGPVLGLTIAYRSALLTGLAIRAYTLIRRPVIEVRGRS